MVIRIGSGRAETLRGTPDGDLLDGRGGDDRLIGLGGDDLLAGGPGANRIDGGAGRDTVAFFVDQEEQAVRGSSEPTRVDLARGVYVVGGDSTSLAGIEDAFAGDADDVVAGDGRANRLFGLRGDDTLRGRGGGDFLDDGDGSDLVFGGYGADVIDTVSGLSGRDEVHAGAGADVLSLGAGGDQVWGDAGADRFLISVTGGPGAPLFTIRDFEVVGGDLIDLSFLDVDGAGGQEGFEFVGQRVLSANGIREVRLEQRGGETIVRYEDTDEGTPASVSVNEFALSGRIQLTASDFVLDFV